MHGPCGYVANTDFEWFTFLASRRREEVNFWQPSGRGFRVLRPGEPLFLRLKRPRNCISGFGPFARHKLASARLAWDAFGELNGARTFEERCTRIEKYRPPGSRDPLRHYTVGCIMVAQPVLFEESGWLEQPRDWAANTVSGAGYDLEFGEGKRLWEQCRERPGVRPSRGYEPFTARHNPSESQGARIPALTSVHGR